MQCGDVRLYRDETTVRDRIRRDGLSDGRVRHEGRTSSDDGETGDEVFLGFYEPADEGSTP